MNMTKKNKTIISLSVISLVIILGVIFSMIKGGGPSVKAPKEPNKIVKHEEMTKELKSEKQVSSGEVYLKSDVVVANITLKQNTTKDQAKELANKYAKELNNQYKGMPVIVDVKQGDKDIVKEMIPQKEDQLAAEAKVFMGVEYIKADFKDFLEKDITKVLMNEKQLEKKSYKVTDGLLTIMKANKNSKIKVVIGKKTYNVVFIQK
ncbi:hypothetical protein [Clostridium tagluense]|uniref:hypothetical protein n=1 Tax=Clostridium tagluense TaxID=360422 RepID=UPI001C6ED68A|nr:hypothetical protein [Clostridium tagluense]MBW9156990.1 hypothetical protein [Clostridium tagluense]WLC64977.1 hypothetical protein KTC93_19380 [Clostridium tagluense]